MGASEVNFKSVRESSLKFPLKKSSIAFFSFFSADRGQKTHATCVDA